MQVCKAQALYMCGEPYKHAAALLVSEALHKDPEHEGALLEYVRIVMDRGLFADAMRILLRLLVNSHERTAVRQAGSLGSSPPNPRSRCSALTHTSVLDVRRPVLCSASCGAPALLEPPCNCVRSHLCH